jgi:hypothetical protein
VTGRSDGCALIAIALALTALGIMCVVAGLQLTPRDRATAQAFRTDRSCAVPLNDTAPPGDCTIVVAKILYTAMRTGSSGRMRSRTPYVYVRLADGTSYTDDLDGSDGRTFAETVNAGAPARAQLFRGKLVRVVSGSSSAETVSAPDVTATNDAQMPWVGGALILLSAPFAVAAVRAMRRAQAPGRAL